MSYAVFCTFDLKNATTQDYKNAYADLEKIGLKKVVAGSKREVVIPTTAALGSFNGANADSIRDDIRQRIQNAFKARGFSSEIFVLVGGEDWTWGAVTT
jgi:hypothetical protein